MQSTRTSEPSIIQQALNNQHYAELKALLSLDNYRASYDLDEIKALVTNQALEASIRYTAYFYLVGHAELETLQALSAYMNFKFKDGICNAGMIAVSRGRQDVLRWLQVQGIVGLDYLNINGSKLILVAIYHGQLPMLQALLKPIDQGGYGLSLDVKNTGRRDTVLIAMSNARLDILQALLKPIDQGGYGLDILDVTDDHLKEGIPHPDLYIWIVLAKFDCLLNRNGLANAIEWVSQLMKSSPPDFIKAPLISHYEKLLQALVGQNRLEDAEQLTEALESLSVGRGRVKLVDIYQHVSDYTSAFDNCLSIFEDSECPQALRHEAGQNMAEFIFNGYAVLDSTGQLNPGLSLPMREMSDWERANAGIDANVMMQRAVFAYEYLEGNASDAANNLRAQLNKVLSGVVGTEGKTGLIVWQPRATALFLDYYLKKNRVLLFNECFKNSTGLLRETIDKQTNTATQSSLRLFAPNPKRKIDQISVEEEQTSKRLKTDDVNTMPVDDQMTLLNENGKRQAEEDLELDEDNRPAKRSRPNS